MADDFDSRKFIHLETVNVVLNMYKSDLRPESKAGAVVDKFAVLVSSL